MLNIQVEVTAGPPIAGEDAITAIRVMRRVIAKDPDRVIHRVRVRALWGLARPSFAIRARHIAPFLRWLAQGVAPVQSDSEPAFAPPEE